jgi:hypothetical protein
MYVVSVCVWQVFFFPSLIEAFPDICSDLITVLLNIIGAVSFVLYRRRFLNKPQTLNDKCSNPDSSGYIDDSTLRVSAHKEKVSAVRT